MDALALALASLEATPPPEHRAFAERRAAALEARWWGGNLVWTCPGPHGPLFHRKPHYEAMQRWKRCIAMEMEP